MQIPIEVSARHIHLTSEDYIKIFGSEELEKVKDLSQIGEFAASQKVRIVGVKNEINIIKVTMVTKDELAEVKQELKNDFNQLLNSVDNYAKRQEEYFLETISLRAKFERPQLNV